MNTTDKAILTIEELSKAIAALRTQLADAEVERDALKAALERIAAPGVNEPDYQVWFEECQAIARAALSNGGAK